MAVIYVMTAEVVKTAALVSIALIAVVTSAKIAETVRTVILATIARTAAANIATTAEIAKIVKLATIAKIAAVSFATTAEIARTVILATIAKSAAVIFAKIAESARIAAIIPVLSAAYTHGADGQSNHITKPHTRKHALAVGVLLLNQKRKDIQEAHHFQHGRGMNGIGLLLQIF